MASLEQRTDYFNVVFYFRGKKYTRSLRTKDKKEANTRRVRLEETIRLVESGRLVIPEGADAVTFLLSDGHIQQRHVEPDSSTTPQSIHDLFETFFADLPDNNLEATTIRTIKTHQQHLSRILGKTCPVLPINKDSLQRYIGLRSKERGRRGRQVSPTTIKKELASLRAVWNWSFLDDQHSHGRFPPFSRLRFDKTNQRPAFQTWEQIERQIERGSLREDEQAELWECLFLRRREVKQLLKYLQKHATQPWLYPMVVMAAHTGARRSELLRSEINDLDGDTVTIRERKRSKAECTTRTVPKTPTLCDALDEWLHQHPGGRYTFAQSTTERSKRKAREAHEPVTRNEATHHLRQSLMDSKWVKVPGWHCLRHSFISILASDSVDQRLIDDYVGHTTEDMRRRYRHLLPETKAKVLNSVFG